MEISDDGSRYMVNADQFFFQTEHKKNHKCPHCGSVLWAPVVPGRQIPWAKIGGYGWVYREQARRHMDRTKNAAVLDQLQKIAENPDGYFPVKGAVRRYPLSTYIKKKLRGRIDGFLADELHEYNNASGQGDAMAEIYGAARQFVGMTATLINGYSSGIFHLLYRIVPGLMRKDGKSYRSPIVFITDGQCKMPEDFLEELRKEQTERRFTINGVLLDSDSPGMEFSLRTFCQNIYRTSELAGEEIVRELVSARI